MDPSPSPPSLPLFLTHFYTISDTPTAHDSYTTCFTPDAHITMGSKRADGRAQILALRKGMWENVSTRRHWLGGVFGGGGQGEKEGGDIEGNQKEGEVREIMLYGTVDYGFKDGRRVDGVEWAGRAELVLVEEEEEGGEGEGEKGKWKFRFYHVYLDSAAMAAAK